MIHVLIVDGVDVRNMTIQKIELPDYFKDNQLYLGENMEVMKFLHSESIDMVYCCLPETKIRMRDERLLNIENINVGDKVFAGGNVLNTMCREYNGIIYEFELMGIYDNLHVTEEHPLLIIKQKDVYEIKTKNMSKWYNKDKLDNTKIHWIEAKNIEIGDFLLNPCYPENILNIENVKIGNSNIKCDEEFGWILGFWLAEGHIVHYYGKDCLNPQDINNIKNGKQSTMYNYLDLDTNKVNKLTDELTTIMDKKNKYESSYTLVYSYGELDITCGFVDKLNDWYDKHFNGRAKSTCKPNESVYQTCYYIEEMAKFLHENFGEHAINKKISKELLNYPIEFQKGLLRGWIDGDGGIWKEERNRVKITGSSISKQLTFDMYLISIRLGLRPSLKQRGKNERRTILGKECNVKITWDVYFSSLNDIKYIYPEHYIDLNKENINEKITKGNLRIITSNKSIERTRRKIITKGNLKFILTPVTKILKREYNGKVYNLTTESHVYVTNYILSHNCDPPYYSQQNYKTKSKTDKDVVRSFTDTFTDLTEYLHFLHARLVEMKRLLKPNGSIYIHLDWHSSHYVKVMMDNLFGYDNFINNIVWCYTGGGSGKRCFAKKHDDILLYSKSDKYIFNYNDVSIPYAPGTEVLIDEKNGKKYYLKSGIRYYIERSGKILEDWWTCDDIPNLNHNKLEDRHDYPTEKPWQLLERCIKASSNPGDTVADFFGGSGVTAAVAQKLNRKWIICDKSEQSVELIKARLLGNKSIKEKSYQLPIEAMFDKF